MAAGIDTGNASSERKDDGSPALDGEGENDSAKQFDLCMKHKEEGTEFYKVKKYAEARAAWKEAQREMPRGQGGPTGSLARLDFSLHLNLAQVGLQLKDFKDVIVQATEALKLDSESSKAFYRRGLAFDALGEVKPAAADLHKAAKLEPMNADIRKKFEELKQKAQALDKDEEEVPPEHNLRLLPKVFVDVSIGKEAPVRLIFSLYTDTVPKTAENFRSLLTGEHKPEATKSLTARGKPFHYKGSILHRVIPGLMVQGGDFENANGTGGESIYGRRFPDERFCDKHTRRGLLAMANDGPNTNGSNFFVTFAAAEHLDKKHVIFGEVHEGWELLDQLEKLEANAECRPLKQCVIVDCGELKDA